MILALVLFALLIVGVPLFVVIGVAAAVAFGLYAGHGGVDGLVVLVVKLAGLTTKNVFLAIPFFIISGAIMSAGSIAARLVAVAEALVGGLRGGLAVAALVASVIFAALSGSSPVTLIAIGGIMFPAMVRAGYRESFALGFVTTAGSLGCLVPPSIPMLVYAISVTGTSGVDVRELFLAGMGAALVVVLMLAAYAVVRAGPVQTTEAFSWPRLEVALREGVWALALPVLILGGIYGGLFTPTEASAVSVVYAVVVETLVHRSLSLRQLPDVVVKATTNMGGLLLVIGLSLAVNDFMVEAEVAEAALRQVRALGLGPVGFMMVVNVFLVVTGMFMDSISAIVLFTPVIAPAAVALGIDPLHLGVVFIVNMEIGYLAPPIATNLFVAATVFKKPFGLVVRSVIPTLLILGAGLLLLTYVPTLTVGPVHALRGASFFRPFAAAAPAPKTTPDPDPAMGPAKSEADGAKNEVLTLEEMMRLMKAKRAAEAATEEATPPEVAPAKGADDPAIAPPAGASR
ncbi:MAG: TRAP transporter large permease subunit [Myxococcales bacterium]|nr:TRAP transporter large permease subunit [Myxococcales bacterium]